MEKKASKRDIAWSKSNLLKDTENHKLNSAEGEIWFENHMKIDNTNLSPDEVADMVIEKFKLIANDKDENDYPILEFDDNRDAKINESYLGYFLPKDRQQEKGRLHFMRR